MLPEEVEIDIMTNDTTYKKFITIHTTKNDLLKFNERSFFETSLVFFKNWNCAGVYTCEKPKKFQWNDRTHLQCG